MIAVSVLGPLGYILVLFAMKIAPIGHVAPARELATLVGSYFGVKLLKERMTPQRILGAVLIVSGCDQSVGYATGVDRSRVKSRLEKACQPPGD